MNSISTSAQKNLPNWMAVLNFLASLTEKRDTRSVTITRENENNWHVETTSESSSQHERKHINRGVALYDFYW